MWYQLDRIYILKPTYREQFIKKMLNTIFDIDEMQFLLNGNSNRFD